MSDPLRDVTRALLGLLEAGEAAALATVVRVSGSTPQAVGARLLLHRDGAQVGTVGGGAIEFEVLAALRDAIRSGRSHLLERNLGPDLGMCCGGQMSIFIEAIAARPRLVLFGAGHVAQPTARMAQGVGFEVLVVDPRADLNSEERFPGCGRRQVSIGELFAGTSLGPGDHVLIVTHDHALDEEALDAALGSDAAYIGLVGSRRKVLRLLQRITARRGPVDRRRLYAPVGLDLGAVTPDEIAVSIVAELVALRHGRAPSHLRELGPVPAPPPSQVLSLGKRAKGQAMVNAPPEPPELARERAAGCSACEPAGCEVVAQNRYETRGAP